MGVGPTPCVWGAAFGQLPPRLIDAIIFFMEFTQRLPRRRREKGVSVFMRILYSFWFYTSLVPDCEAPLATPQSKVGLTLLSAQQGAGGC